MYLVQARKQEENHEVLDEQATFYSIVKFNQEKDVINSEKIVLTIRRRMHGVEFSRKTMYITKTARSIMICLNYL
jgi:hypothetical protein